MASCRDNKWQRRLLSERPPAARRPISTITAYSHLSVRTLGMFSTDAGMLLRRNTRMLRHIILQDNTEFKRVWTKRSKSPIYYEGGRIYFDNYRSCFCSIPPTPQHMYELPKCPKAEKIEAAILCQSSLEKVLHKATEQKSCLLALSANNWLYRFCLRTGKLMQKVYLSSHFKFRYLGWDVPQESFCIKSVQNKQTAQRRQAGPDHKIMFYLAAFRVFPLEVMGVMEIDAKVFGSTVVDVILSQGLLVVSHSTKVVKLYSFEDIVAKHTTKPLVLGEVWQAGGAGAKVGELPFGLTVNIHISETPPVLFELQCWDNDMQIGGFPWHYIYTPSHRKHHGTYQIRSLEDGSLACNGIQDMQCCSLEPDWIYFHPDDSGRIIHVGPSRINVLKIIRKQHCLTQSEVVHEFFIAAHRDNSAEGRVSVTSSGRPVKRRFQQLDDDPEKETFSSVEYEDELDLLAAVEVTLRDDKGAANVGLYDNQTGTLLKRIPLVESWDVTYSQKFFFDRDTIIHVEQEKNNNFCCHVYKISSKQEAE